jgi:hypothetical protein
MSSFNRELFSLTSAMPELAGGAKRRGSKKGSKKASKKDSKKGSKKSQKGGKKGSKKGSKKSSRKQSRDMPEWMKNMLEVKKEIKNVHTDIKDGPSLTKVVMEAIKSKGDVKGAVDHLSKMSSSELKSKLDKVNKEIAEKRAAKKASA